MAFNKLSYFHFSFETNSAHPALVFRIKIGFINKFAIKVENYKQKLSNVRNISCKTKRIEFCSI